MKNSEKFTVEYNANPNVPYDMAHMKGPRHEFTDVRKKTFNSSSKAVDFWYECYLPITPLSQLGIANEVANEIELEAEELELLEEQHVRSQQDIYQMMEED